MFATLGMTNYGMRAMSSVGDDRTRRSQVFWSAYFSQVIVSAIVVAAYFIYSFVVLQSEGIYALLWSMWVISCAVNVTWLFFGSEDFKRTTVRSFVVKILELIAIFSLIRGPEDVWIYVAIDSVCFLLNQVVLWPFVKDYVDPYRPSWDEIKVHFIPSARLFIPVVAVSLYTTLNKVLLGNLSTMEETGYYDYAEKMSKMPMAIITSLGTVMLPHMSNIFSEGHRKQGLQLIETSIWFMLASAFGLTFGIMGVAEEFVPVFFGDGFLPCVPVMALLSWVIPFICMTNVIGVQYLLPSFRDTQYTISVCAGAVINIILCLVLIPSFGAFGSAVGTVSAEAVVLIVQVFFVRKELPVARYLRNSIPFLVIGIAMFVALRMLANVLTALWGVSILTLIVEILAGVIIYVALAIAYCVATHNAQFKGLFGKYFPMRF
jgi:O-antigen/teichoic acid export membrane protein